MRVWSVIACTSLALVLLVAPPARAEVSAQLSSESATLLVHEPFRLRLEVHSDAPPEVPELPTVPDLAVVAVRRLPSEPAQRRHGFQIELICQREGTLTIPPFVVLARGESTRTNPLQLQIGQPRVASEMQLHVAVTPRQLRVGQAAAVTVTWSSEVSFERCKQLRFDIPLLRDQRCQIFPVEPPPSETDIGLPVNNLRVVAQASQLDDGRQALVLRYQLIPRQPGVLRAPPAQLLCALLKQKPSVGQSPGYFYNHFFESTQPSEAYEEVYLAAETAELTVRELPETGRTPHFAGVVGPCTLRTSVVPRHLTVGQPALFTVQLDDLTWARHLDALPPAAFQGLRAGFQLSQHPIRETSADNTRSFTYTLRPLHTHVNRIAAVVVQAFDPSSGQYRTLRSDPLAITVDADPNDLSRVFAARIDAVAPIQLHGVRQNRASERMMMAVQSTLLVLGHYWWIVVLVLPLLWLAVRPLAWHWDRCRRDAVYARATAAWSRFRRARQRDEQEAWRNYLADRLALCAESLTADTVTAALRARNVDAQLIAEARQRFEDQDAADYGRRAAIPARDTQRLVRRLQKATPVLLVLCALLVPCVVASADDADDLFARAMQLRQQKPDEAQPLLVEAALQFESNERFLNAGNSWFFAGENGRALANYRAAERRAPLDRQLRESIEYLRANRADAFPPPAVPTGLVAAWWNRFGTWAPKLRVGSCMLAYSLAWFVYITARLAGRRVPRGVWILLLAAITMPLISLTQSSLQHPEGVVITDSTARLGPGYAYEPAFQQPLHQATEFKWLETRSGWVHCQLPDGSMGWLRQSACLLVQ